jgi:hypothetical protein
LSYVSGSTYLRVGYVKDDSLGWALASLANIKLGLKGIPRTNTLAYYELSYITAVKSFMTLSPGPTVIKLIISIIY